MAAALADAMGSLHDGHDAPPPPDARDIGDVRHRVELLAVVDRGDRAALHRRREIIGGGSRVPSTSWSNWTGSPRMRWRCRLADSVFIDDLHPPRS